MYAPKLDHTPLPSLRQRRARYAWRSVTLAVSALLAGSRAIPLGDNGELMRQLARRAAQRA